MPEGFTGVSTCFIFRVFHKPLKTRLVYVKKIISFRFVEFSFQQL